MTRNLIRLHAKKTAQQMNIDNFLVSSGWCTRFMKRNKEEDSSQVEEEPDCDDYDDRITPEQWQELFGESDDEEEFHGF